MEWREGDLVVSDAREAVDLDFVTRMLRSSYWASERSRVDVARSIESSVPLSLFEGERQVGFARVVTDGVTFAWVADVVVDPDARGRGLGKWLMRCVLEHPLVAGSTQQLLRTRDAHSLYERFGFTREECMTRQRDP